MAISTRTRVARTTNPHDQTKSTDLGLRFTLTQTPQRGCLSIYSTDSYRGVTIPIFGNQLIGQIVKAGGRVAHLRRYPCNYSAVIDLGLVGGRDTTRAEDALGTPAQSHMSPTLEVCEDKIGVAIDF